MTKSRWWSWPPVFIWIGVIFWMSSDTFSSQHTSRILIPLLHFLFSSQTPEFFDSLHAAIRKTAHITEYFILGLLSIRALRASGKRESCLSWAAYALVIVLFCAICDEFHQSFVSSRTSSIIDVIIDATGGILSVTAFFFYLKIYQRKK